MIRRTKKHLKNFDNTKRAKKSNTEAHRIDRSPYKNNIIPKKTNKITYNNLPPPLKKGKPGKLV